MLTGLRNQFSDQRLYIYLFVIVSVFLKQLQANDPAYGYGIREKIPTEEYNALVEFYESVGGSGWTGWLDPDAEFWEGVSVSNVVYKTSEGPEEWIIEERGHVDGILLTFKTYSGTLPESIGDLTELETLLLSNLSGIGSDDSGLSGPLPSSIGNLEKLTSLNLSFHDFEGEIPSSYGNLIALESLQLQGNKLVGPIPPWLGDITQLSILELSLNRLTGEIPLTLGNLQSLAILSLQGNCHSLTNESALISLLPSGTTVFLTRGFDCEDDPGNSVLPDLIALEFALDETEAIPQQTVEASFRVKNDGEGFSDAFTVCLYLSSSIAVDALKDEIVCIDIPGLAPGETDILRSRKFFVPSCLDEVGMTEVQNQYYIRIEIDPENRITESNETNNYLPDQDVYYDALKITGPPEIIFKKFDAHHVGHLGEGFSPGDDLLVNWIIKNVGYGDILDPFDLQFYFDPPAARSAFSPEFLGEYNIGSGLRSGETETGDFLGKIPPDCTQDPVYDPFGNGFYVIEPDIEPWYLESLDCKLDGDEVNKDTVIVENLRADLKVGQVIILDGRLPSARVYKAGDPIRIYYEYINDSPVLIEDPFDVELYISEDEVIDPIFDKRIYHSRPQIGHRRTTHRNQPRFTLPPDTDPFWMPGLNTYYIGLAVDTIGEIPDCNPLDDTTSPSFAKVLHVDNSPTQPPTGVTGGAGTQSSPFIIFPNQSVSGITTGSALGATISFQIDDLELGDQANLQLDSLPASGDILVKFGGNPTPHDYDFIQSFDEGATGAFNFRINSGSDSVGIMISTSEAINGSNLVLSQSGSAIDCFASTEWDALLLPYFSEEEINANRTAILTGDQDNDSIATIIELATETSPIDAASSLPVLSLDLSNLAPELMVSIKQVLPCIETVLLKSNNLSDWIEEKSVSPDQLYTQPARISVDVFDENLSNDTDSLFYKLIYLSP